MKKIIVGCLTLCALASCNPKDSKEYKTLQAEKDSLAALMSQGEAENAELEAIINEVEENFNQIRESQKIISNDTQKDGKLSTSAKERVAENFAIIKDLIAKNQEKIEKLNKLQASSKKELSSYKKRIESLNSQLEAANAENVRLNQVIAAMGQEIASLNVNIDNLNQKVDNLEDANAKQANKIDEQDQALNTAYYVFGTKNELKDMKIVSGGFLSSTKVLKDIASQKNNFVKVDIRNVKSIPLYAKDAKLLSNHPANSYSLEKDANKQVVLRISDYKAFWSLGQYLVVEVKP